MIEKMLLGVICLLPLLPALGGYGFEQIKVVFFLLTISLIGLLWLVTSWKQKFTWTRLNIASLIFLMALLVSCLTGVDLEASLLGQFPYSQGWIVYVYLFSFSLMVAVLKVPVNKIAMVLSFSSAIVALIAIIQSIQLYLLHMNIPNYAGRVVSTFGQPDLYASFLLFNIPLIYGYATHSNGKLFYRLVIFMGVAAIIISQSRLAILLLLFLIVIFLMHQLKFTGRLLAGLVILMLLLVSLFSIVLNTGLFRSEFSEPKDALWLKSNSPEKRLIIWPVIAEVAFKKPLLGYGLENLDKAFSGYEKPYDQRFPAYYSLKNLQLDRAHNYPLDLLIFSGILGLISWIYLNWLLLKDLNSYKNKFLLISYLIYFIWILFQVQSIVNLIYFWLLVGLAENWSVDKVRKNRI